MPIDPGAASSPNGSPAQQAPPSVLAGMQSDDVGSPSPQSQGNDGLGEAMAQVRKLKVDVTELGRQFPAAAPALQKASKALEDAMQLIAANPGTPEPPAPNIGG